MIVVYGLNFRNFESVIWMFVQCIRIGYSFYQFIPSLPQIVTQKTVFHCISGWAIKNEHDLSINSNGWER